MVINIINKNGQTNNHQKTHVRHMAKVPTYPHHQGLLQWVKRCVPMSSESRAHTVPNAHSLHLFTLTSHNQTVMTTLGSVYNPLQAKT